LPICPGYGIILAMSESLWIAKSKFGKAIRLTEKIWSEKILKEHPEFSLEPKYLDELRKTIESPEYIVEGWQEELLALRWCEIAPNSPKYLCIVYREYGNEGFVITAFFISRYGKLLRRKIKWPKQML
jgi:hypothetical protein